MGDFTVLGWATTLLYFMSVYASYVAYQRATRSGLRLKNEAKGWRAIFLFMLVLGLNKQLDLQLWLTEIGKHLIVAMKIYRFHRAAQVAAFVAALVVAFGSAAYLAPVFFKASFWLRVAFAGLGLVAAFALLRAARFQKMSSHVDSPLVVWLEPLGIIVIFTAATMGARWLTASRQR